MMRSRLSSLATAMAMAFASSAQAAFLFDRLVPPPPATEGNGPSTTADVSGDGKLIVFESDATNFVTGSISGGKILAVDLGASTVEVISETGAGAAFNGNSFSPATAGNGRYVAFETFATNLDLGITTSGFQIVRKDRATGALALASASASGAPASGSAAGQARNASISADGRFVAFRSDSANFVQGDGADSEDLFVKDLETGAIELINRTTSGGFASEDVVAPTAHSISADGRNVVFQTRAPNMVAGVAGGTILVYLRDRSSGTTELVSAAAGGAPANSQSDAAAISPNGRFVSFRSFANNLPGPSGTSRVFVRDRIAGTTTLVPFPIVNGSAANGCRDSDVADSGVVILQCFFPNVPDQVFLHVPGATGTPFLISSDTNDQPGNMAAEAEVAIDASGLSMVFASRANNLVAGDGNNVADVFVLIDDSVLSSIFADGFE